MKRFPTDIYPSFEIKTFPDGKYWDGHMLYSRQPIINDCHLNWWAKIWHKCIRTPESNIQQCVYYDDIRAYQCNYCFQWVGF